LHEEYKGFGMKMSGCPWNWRMPIADCQFGYDAIAHWFASSKPVSDRGRLARTERASANNLALRACGALRAGRPRSDLATCR
jgi:hypothetical protein